MTRLEDLARSATVRLGPVHDDNELWGSGFFVAPGWVLTCFHVLRDQLETDGTCTLLVQNAKVRASACLAYRVAGAGDFDQDLALLRLLDADAEAHPCVWLTDRGDKPPRVAAFGWRKPGEAAPAREWSGYCEVVGVEGAYGRRLGPEIEVHHGVSGGPVVDPHDGSVVGVVKAKRQGKDGGLAISTTALRSFGTALPVADEKSLGEDPYRELMRLHDQWHVRCTPVMSWTSVQGRHGGWQPQDRMEALSLLSELPQPGSPLAVEALVETALGEEKLWVGNEPSSWRDGHGQLYEGQSADGNTSELIFLHYLLLVSSACANGDTEAAARLERWTRRRSEALPPPFRKLLASVQLPKETGASERTRGARNSVTRPVAQTDLNPVVAVELDPAHYPHGERFYWRVWVWSGGADTVRSWAEGETGEGTPLENLPYQLSGPLNEAFGQMDSSRRRARLEIAIPVEYFDMGVHLWCSRLVARSIRPHPAETPFGVHRQVVLRDLQRRGAPSPGWEARWHRVLKGGVREVLRLPVYDSQEETLSSAPSEAVPVLCRPAAEGTDSLKDAIGAGHGLALWSRDTPHPYGCSEACEQFHDRTAELLRTSGSAMALPEELRALRERIYRDEPEATWAESLALLYDDPRRPIPEPTGPLDSP